MSEIRFVDTTLRDGQMSLWATNMTTAQMLPVLEPLDRAGFEAIEILAAAFFKKLVRDLRDDPWERIDRFRERIRRTPLRAIRGRYMSAFQITPLALEDLFVERLAAHGIREVRISDCSNTVAVWDQQLQSARRAGLSSIVNLIYSVSPKHTDEYYAARTRSAAALKPERICLKDPGGLLTPERAKTLVPAILSNADGVRVELHNHCNTGLGALACLEAIRQGIRSVNTALAPLADASSNPSLSNIARNARLLGFEANVDEASLKPVEEHLRAVARSQGWPLGAPAAYDAYQYVHQVPGGMISNLRYQLGRVGMEEKLPEVLEETARVRQEFGYPIMVTPYSQFVGSQATMNVIRGERYRSVSDEVLQYALGLWGEEESSSMDANVRDRLAGTPRAKELKRRKAPQPSLKEIRSKYEAGISDDEFLMRYLAGEDLVIAMRSAPAEPQAIGPSHLISHLVAELAKHAQCGYIRVRRDGLSLSLQKSRG